MEESRQNCEGSLRVAAGCWARFAAAAFATALSGLDTCTGPQLRVLPQFMIQSCHVPLHCLTVGTNIRTIEMLE